MSEAIEVRPCYGDVHAGELVGVAPRRKRGYFAVQRCEAWENPIGVAVTNSHALGFVALSRAGHNHAD